MTGVRIAAAEAEAAAIFPAEAAAISLDAVRAEATRGAGITAEADPTTATIYSI